MAHYVLPFAAAASNLPLLLKEAARVLKLAAGRQECTLLYASFYHRFFPDVIFTINSSAHQQHTAGDGEL